MMRLGSAGADADEIRARTSEALDLTIPPTLPVFAHAQQPVKTAA
jgi:hypothetical protein